MKRTICLRARNLIATALLLVFQSTDTTAQNDTVKTIERLEEEMNTAFNRYDAAAIDRLWSEDLAFVSPNGTLSNKTQRLAGLNSPPSNIPASTIESVTASVYGDVVVAGVVSKWTGTIDGKATSSRFRATHVWARRAGQWRLVAAHVSQMSN